MTTEGGARLDRLADFIGLDDTGFKITEDGESVVFEVDSAAYPSKTVRIDPDDIDAVCERLKLAAYSIRIARS
jgi:hypothetical protein